MGLITQLIQDDMVASSKRSESILMNVNAQMCARPHGSV